MAIRFAWPGFPPRCCGAKAAADSEMAPDALEKVRLRLEMARAAAGRPGLGSNRQRLSQVGRQPEISSKARLVVRGPNTPIVAITTPIAAAMKIKTPMAPARSSTKAMTNELKMTESRLHE